MKEQEQQMIYYDENGVPHEAPMPQEPEDDIGQLNINQEMEKAERERQQNAMNQQNAQANNAQNAPQQNARVKVSPEFINGVKKLKEAYDKLNDNQKKNPEQGLPLLHDDIEEFKAIADKEAETNKIIAPGWKKTFDQNLKTYGPSYIDFFIKDTAKQCGIAAELGVEVPAQGPVTDDMRLQQLRSEKERIQREIDALEAKRGAEAEAKNDLNLKGYTLDKKTGLKSKNFQWDSDAKDREKQIRQSEENGYKTREEVKDSMTFGWKKETRSMRRFARELGKEGKLGKKNPTFKELQTNLEALDNIVSELSGKTRLTADELEALDMATANAYNATVKFQKKTKDEIAGRKRIQDKDGTEREDIKEHERVALEGVDEIQKQVQALREKAFEGEVKEKVKELNEKCENEAANLDAERTKLGGKEMSEDMRIELEDNIARSLYYNNRMHDLGKQGLLKIQPGRTLGTSMRRLENQIIPDGATLDMIKNSELCKNIVNKAQQKLEKGEAFTNEDIIKGQKSYEQEMGNRMRQQNRMQQNRNPQRNVQNPELNQNAPTM